MFFNKNGVLQFGISVAGKYGFSITRGEELIRDI
jgi:hypothetical protein